MEISNILFYFCGFVCLIFAKTIGHLYESKPCLSALSVITDMTTTTILECAILSTCENQEAFSFNSQTGQCSIFTVDTNLSSTCEMSSHVNHFQINDCPLPVPHGYTLLHPYYNSKALAVYRCTTFTDQPPVDHCPVYRCEGPSNIADPPTSCSVKDVFNSSLSIYEGGVTCTIDGVTCQRWDTEYPHFPRYFIGRSDLGNRCQLNAGNRPWCYTTDPDVTWSYCPVEENDCEAQPPIQTLSSNTTVEININWPHLGSLTLASYRCESLTGAEPVTSCPVSYCDGHNNWSEANVSCSAKDCFNVTSQSYEGRVSCTQLGITCQRWDSNVPHVPSLLNGRSDIQNWCQKEGGDRPWCYTIDPDVEWDYCHVDTCN